MGGIIFFVVLIAWICLSVWLARKIVGWLPIDSAIAKFVIGVLTFGLVLSLPVLDEIIGKVQVDKLCREEGGVKVYGKLELGPEFFNGDGTPNFINPGNGNISERIEPYIELVLESYQEIPSVAKLSKGRLLIKSRKDGNILLESTDFDINGGRFIPYRPKLFHADCPNSRQRYDKLLKQIIVRKN
jgi:hypothetical protein